MKFCANVSILFKEVAFLERFDRAARAGFAAVEFWWPADPAVVARGVDGVEHEREFDLAGAGLAAAGRVGDLDVGDATTEDSLGWMPERSA